MNFETLYNFLSLARPGRSILKHFGVEPLKPGTFIELGVGIQDTSPWNWRMVQTTDGDWTYLTDEQIEDHAAKNIPIKSGRQLEAERKQQSPELADHYRRRALRFLAETQAKAAEEKQKYHEHMRVLEKIYLQARTINQEAACQHSDKIL
jgi:hypothetical protein